MMLWCRKGRNEVWKSVEHGYHTVNFENSAINAEKYSFVTDFDTYEKAEKYCYEKNAPFREEARLRKEHEFKVTKGVLFVVTALFMAGLTFLVYCSMKEENRRNNIKVQRNSKETGVTK